jgi:hypothetical protein
VGIDLYRVAAVAIDTAFNDRQDRRSSLSGGRAVAAGATLAAAAYAARHHGPRISKLSLAKFGISTLGDISKLRGVPDAVLDRLSNLASDHDDSEPDGSDEHADYGDEEDEDEAGPEAEADEEDEDEDDTGPDAEADDEDEEEDEDEDDTGPDAEADDEEEDEDDPGPEAAEDEDDEGDDDEPVSEEDDAGLEIDDEDWGEADDDSDNGGGPVTARQTPDLTAVLSAQRTQPPVLRQARRRLDPADRPPEPIERARDESD